MARRCRDSLAWSTYIDDAIELFGDRTDAHVRLAPLAALGHRRTCASFLGRQRDLYRWIHDQTLRLANHGHVATEIAEMLRPATEHYEESHTVGYYGSLIHNVKAVYQRYLSWYDGNPCHLHPHPPVEAGQRYVALAGGADALLAAAQAAYDAGRLPLGRRAGQPPRVRRPDQHRGAYAAGRRATSSWATRASRRRSATPT